MESVIRLKQLSVKVLTASTFFVMLAGQTAPDAPARPDEIVVTGNRDASALLRQRAVAYVRAMGVANGERAIARWIDPICPKALGVGDQHARLVETQIRKVAETLLIKTAKLPCRSNITISFVSDAGAIMRRIALSKNAQFGEVSIDRRQSLIDGQAPIRWWHTTELLGRNGDRQTDFAPPAVQIVGGGSLPLGPETQVLSQYSSSTVSTQIIRALRSSTIVVDVNRAHGASLEAVSTFAAVVGLAEIRFGGEPMPNLILSLFDEAKPVTELTEWDKSFLRELYSVPLDRLARYQRGRLIDALASSSDVP